MAKSGQEIALAYKEKENPKSFYKYIKGKRVRLLKDLQGHRYVEPQEMGEFLNEYFSLVFTVEKGMDVGDQKRKCWKTLAGLAASVRRVKS